MPQRPYTDIVAANGVALIEITSGAQKWNVTQVSTKMDTVPTGASCEMTINGSIVSGMWPRGDVASGEPTITLYPGDTLAITWTGCTPGTVAKANAFYEVIA